MPATHMMIGNVGSGKSELAAHMARKWPGAVVVNMDSIQASIHGGEYGRYEFTMKPVYHAVEEVLITTALKADLPVILDRTNMTARGRARFIEIAKQYTDEIKAYTFPDANFDKCIRRRMKNPRGVPEIKWKEIISGLLKSYEPPTHEEGFTDFINIPQNYSHNFLAVDFDGTIVGHEFPDIGAPIQAVIKHMKEFWNRSLFHRIIIWSCRGGEYESEMREWLIANKIPFDFINENPIISYGSHKIFANEYLDDRNITLKD